MAKIKLIWVECPKCGGDGGFTDFDSPTEYDMPCWVDCILCEGKGKTQMGIPEEVKNETKTQT